MLDSVLKIARLMRSMALLMRRTRNSYPGHNLTSHHISSHGAWWRSAWKCLLDPRDAFFHRKKNSYTVAPNHLELRFSVHSVAQHAESCVLVPRMLASNTRKEGQACRYVHRCGTKHVATYVDVVQSMSLHTSMRYKACRCIRRCGTKPEIRKACRVR